MPINHYSAHVNLLCPSRLLKQQSITFFCVVLAPAPRITATTLGHVLVSSSSTPSLPRRLPCAHRSSCLLSWYFRTWHWLSGLRGPSSSPRPSLASTDRCEGLYLCFGVLRASFTVGKGVNLRSKHSKINIIYKTTNKQLINELKVDKFNYDPATIDATPTSASLASCLITHQGLDFPNMPVTLPSANFTLCQDMCIATPGCLAWAYGIPGTAHSGLCGVRVLMTSSQGAPATRTRPSAGSSRACLAPQTSLAASHHTSTSVCCGSIMHAFVSDAISMAGCRQISQWGAALDIVRDVM